MVDDAIGVKLTDVTDGVCVVMSVTGNGEDGDWVAVTVLAVDCNTWGAHCVGWTGTLITGVVAKLCVLVGCTKVDVLKFEGKVSAVEEL